MRAFVRAAWGYTKPYFRGRLGTGPILLLTAVVACQLGFVAAEVARNHWRNDFFQSLQDKDWDEFVRQFWVYLAIAAALILTSVYQTYFSQWLSMRWREWLTSRLLDRWLRDGAHYKIRFLDGSGDNPDQRIAEDTKKFAVTALSLSVGFLGALVTLASFVAILWSISATVGITLGGETYVVPGLLVWAALAYSVVGTLLAHVIGRALIALNYQQDKVEGSFRFGLARVRNHSEEIALLGGDSAERQHLDGRFRDVLQNWFSLIRRQKLLGIFAEFYKHASLYFPYLVLAPFYFAGEMQLGVLMQAGSAFATVRTSLSFFVTAYRELSEWVAVTQRLSGLDHDLERLQSSHSADVEKTTLSGHALISVRGLRVMDGADGNSIGALDKLDLGEGDAVILHAKSGTGKTSIVRVLAGAWPYADGTVKLSNGKRIIALPQRSYMPGGTLKDCVTYPHQAEHVTDQAAKLALRDVGLGHLSDRLHDEKVVETLSGGERQHVSIARVLLSDADVVLLDEATSALEPGAQEELLAAIRRRLPRAAIVATATSTADRISFAPLQREAESL